jgi:SsrA-binding protein
MAKAGKKPERKDLALNRKARFEFEVLERFEAGMVLRGTEVKSIRAGNVSLDESFVRFDGEEAFWVNGTVEEYAHGNVMNHDPKRKRKLLLRASELRKMRATVRQKGLTCVPLRLYLSPRNLIKMEVALVRGKQLHDKRETEKKRMALREARREVD